MNPHQTPDPIQSTLDAVTRQLVKPGFLKHLTPSRLPSIAASEASNSPRGGTSPPHLRSHLGNVSFPEHQDISECTRILTLERNHDGSFPALNETVYENLNRNFVAAHRAFVKMTSDRGFQAFPHGHTDLVLAVDFNYFGTRMVTASSDHRLKVWDKKDDTWSQVDSWRAHDAEIVDVKWNGPFVGEIIGSIAEDGRFKIWQEDVTEMPASGRRFKIITAIPSSTRVPFMSLDFKNIMQDTWAALITRDGYLSVYEPNDMVNLSEWNPIAETYVCPTPSRQEETSFKVCFHQEKLPCWTAIQAGLDRRALSLAVVAMDVVRVYRTDKNRRFYVAAELTGARSIIRDVAWANGSMRGFDIIATAGKDGAIRIYEVSTQPPVQSAPAAANPSTGGALVDNTNLQRGRGMRNAPSGIGAGLASASKVTESTQESDPSRVKHSIKQVAELTQHQGAVWRVAFSQMGDLLVSTGDDGTIRTWKRATDNRWLEYAEIDAANG